MVVTSEMLTATCWMIHGNTWCLLDALGYFLVVICWYSLVSWCSVAVSGC